MSEVFLDTSIIIARFVQSKEAKRRISERLTNYDASITSLIVKQEFKRRLLKEAQYLLNQLDDKGSFQKTLRHVASVLPPQSERKRSICLDMLLTVFEGADDPELTDRAKRYLRTLLRTGLKEFEDSVSYITWESGCACSHYQVKEKIPYKRYEFGPDKCSKTGDSCGVIEFLKSRHKEMHQILGKLKSLPETKKSDELKAAQSFIEKVLDDPASAQKMEPCLKIGDLMIALESVGISVFYTLNSKESQHLCRALGQTLIVRRKNPEHEDVVCSNEDENWPEF
jgi:hypothetical protein